MREEVGRLHYDKRLNMNSTGIMFIKIKQITYSMSFGLKNVKYARTNICLEQEVTERNVCDYDCSLL